MTDRKPFDHTGINVVCEAPSCDVEFELLRKGGNQRRYCSDSCREKHRDSVRRPRRKEPLHLTCEYSPCGADFTHWRRGQKPRYCSTECQVGARDEHRRGLKAKCLSYMGGKCSGCGYGRSAAALHFHHLDPSAKDRKISDFARTAKTSWSEVKAELDKCVLPCANCHAETHWGGT